MNIQLKAGLEVAGFIVSAMAIGSLTRLGLNYLSDVYGADAVVNGIIFVSMSTAAYFAVSLLYDIRVAQLRYKQKLTEIVNK
jgi:hypothetical protein